MRRLKTTVIIALLAISVGTLGSHSAGSLWPWIPVSVGIAVLAVLAGMLWQTNQPSPPVGPSLALVIGIAVFYRMYTFVFPGSMIGIDPDGYAVWINQLVAAGTVEAMNLGFYQNAALFPLINGIFSLISGLPVRKAMVIIPVTTGILIPLTVYVLVQHMIQKGMIRKGLVASLIAVVVTQSVHYSFWPIAQTLATVFLCLLFVVSVRYVYASRNRHRLALLFIIILLSLSLTHKFPVLVVALFVGAFAVLHLLPRTVTQRLDIYEPRQSGIWMLFGITLVMLVIQWGYISDYLNSVIAKVLSVFATEQVTVSSALLNPTAAINPYPEIIGILLRNLHSFALLVAGAVAWLLLAYTKRSERSVQVLLVITAVLFLLFPIGIVAPGALRPTRVMLFIEPFLAALVAVAFIGQRNWSRNILKQVLSVVAVGIIVLVIVTQIIAIGAAPDFPGAPRMYLTSEEVAAKEFGYQYLNHSVTDPYYAGEEAFPDRAVTATGTLDTERRKTYGSLTSALYNATLISGCHPNVLYRQVDVYRFDGPWHLTWNPLPALDRHYNRIYANGGAKHYVRAQCRNTNSTTDA
jgi:hypothetical protein